MAHVRLAVALFERASRSLFPARRSGTSNSYSAWTLRFSDAGVETGYAKSHTKTLLSNLFLFSSICFLLFTFNTGLKFSLGYELDYTLSTPEKHIKFVSRCGEILVGVLCLFTMLLTHVWKRRGVSQLTGEMLVLLVTTSGTFIATSSVYYYTAGLIGVSRDAISHIQHTDAWILLVIDFVTTVTHLFLPVRWITILPLQIFGPALYAGLAFSLGSPQPDHVATNFLTLTALSLCASLGKRVNERHQRDAFAIVIEERTKRCESEFKLSQIDVGAAASTIPTQLVAQSHPSSSSHTGSSRTTATASTARIFDRLEAAATEITNEDDTAKQVLVEVAKLGHKEQWIIADDEVEPVPYVLGRGAYGVVASGRYHGAAVAVKLAVQNRTRLGILRAMSTELRILRHLAHPNIVTFYGAIIHLDHNEVGLVLEHVTGSSLDKLTGQESFGPEHRQKVLVDICNGLRYLHSRSPAVVHGDLKPANVLVQTPIADPLAKLSDFGLARYATVRSRGLGGSIRYMPPEGLSDCMPTSRADVFSFGRLLFAVLVGIEPLIEYSAKDIQKALERGEVMPLTWPPHIVARDKELCDNCLRIVPPERLDILAIHQGLLGGNVQPTLICRLTSL